MSTSHMTNFIIGLLAIVSMMLVNNAWSRLDDPRFFVEQQYLDFLGREGETEGINYWVEQLNSNTLSRAQCIENFYNSQEFQANIAPIVRLYNAYFLRIPDYAGLQFWINSYLSGASLSSISQQFAESAEFLNRYGNLSNDQFINLVYQNVLRRQPEMLGFNYWLGQLQNGMSRGQLMVSFSESEEYQALTRYEVQVIMIYVGMLRRSPEQDGFNFWVVALGSGQSVLELIGEFLNSSEYVGRFTPPTGTLIGAVSGTTIMVVNQQNQMIAIYDTVGKDPDLDLDNNGSLESFSFRFNGITVGEEVRVYLVRAGLILSLYFDTDNDGQLDTNVFRLNELTDVNLGVVDTDLLKRDGIAVPQFSPTANEQVSATTGNPIVPMAVNQPLTTGLSVSQLNEKGLHALSDGWIGGARTYFAAAYQQTDPSDTSPAADTTRFFLALTRVAALTLDSLSDGDASDLNGVGDILDRAGIPNNTHRASWQLIMTPVQLAAGSPNSNEISNFLYQVVKPELQAAIFNLSEVSPGFSRIWNEAKTGENEDAIENDYGDTLFLRGFYKALSVAISIQNSYNLDADIAVAVNPNLDDNPANDTTIEGFLSNHPVFLGLIRKATLAEAKDMLASALDDLNLAIDVINAETDAQGDDVVTLDSLTIWDQNTLAEAKGYLTNAKQSLVGATTIVDYDQTVEPDKQDITLNLQKFFDIGVDFRNPAPGLLPPFEANRANGLFPDATFGEVVLSPDLNKDEDGDGIPDILPSGLTNHLPD